MRQSDTAKAKIGDACREHWRHNRAARLVAYNKPRTRRKAPIYPPNNIKALRVGLLKMSQPEFMDAIAYSGAQAKRCSKWENGHDRPTGPAVARMNELARSKGILWRYHAEGE